MYILASTEPTAYKVRPYFVLGRFSRWRLLSRTSGPRRFFVDEFGTRRPFCPESLGHDVRLSEIIAFEQQRLT